MLSRIFLLEIVQETSISEWGCPTLAELDSLPNCGCWASIWGPKTSSSQNSLRCCDSDQSVSSSSSALSGTVKTTCWSRNSQKPGPQNLWFPVVGYPGRQ